MAKFTACEQLDFSDNYTAKKQLLATDQVFWLRKVIDSSYPAMVQFCKKRGRQNGPKCCLCNEDAMCPDYKDFEHDVDDNSIER